MPERRSDWEDNRTIWQKRAEQARGYADQVQERGRNATDKLFKRRMLRLANRYEQMANMAERAAKEELDRRVN